MVATLSSNRSKKATMRTLWVRGVALEDLRQKQLVIDFDPMESEDVLKAGELVAVLLRVDVQITKQCHDLQTKVRLHYSYFRLD